MTLLRRFGLRVGRRGVFLALFGVVYLLIGYSYLDVAPESAPAVKKALRLALNVAPLEVYGWLWIAAGAVAIISGLFTLTSARRPIGFAAAVIMPALWMVIYLATWIAGDIPRGWVSAIVFAALAAAVATVAGMPEPRDLLKGQRK